MWVYHGFDLATALRSESEFTSLALHVYLKPGTRSHNYTDNLSGCKRRIGVVLRHKQTEHMIHVWYEAQPAKCYNGQISDGAVIHRCG